MSSLTSVTAGYDSCEVVSWVPVVGTGLSPGSEVTVSVLLDDRCVVSDVVRLKSDCPNGESK